MITQSEHEPTQPCTVTPSTLAVGEIRCDRRIQPRAALDDSVVQEYAKLLTDGTVLPSVTVYYDGTTYWLADGFHRVAAHVAANVAHITASVQNGDRRAAQWFAIGANKSHGLRFSNSDKRRAIELMLEDSEWRNYSNRVIADHCGVVKDTVQSVRDKLGLEARDKVISRNGQVQPTRKKTRTKASATVVRGSELGHLGASEPEQNLAAQPEDTLSEVDNPERSPTSGAEPVSESVPKLEPGTASEVAPIFEPLPALPSALQSEPGTPSPAGETMSMDPLPITVTAEFDDVTAVEDDAHDRVLWLLTTYIDQLADEMFLLQSIQDLIRSERSAVKFANDAAMRS